MIYIRTQDKEFLLEAKYIQLLKGKEEASVIGFDDINEEGYITLGTYK